MNDNAPPEPTLPPKLVKAQHLQDILTNERLDKWSRDYKAWEDEGSSLTEEEPQQAHAIKEPKKPPVATYRDVDEEYTMLSKQYTIDLTDEKTYRSRAKPISDWVKDTVDSGILLVV
jgi:hypothetical protein